MPQYDEDTFFDHFRKSRSIVNGIALRYKENDLYKRHSGQYGKLSALNQVGLTEFAPILLIFIQIILILDFNIFVIFIGHQASSFRDMGDRVSITISSVHIIIKTLSVLLSNLLSQIIVWSSHNKKIIIEQHFRENGCPNIIGCIDGKINKSDIDPDS